jgi:hypothetical protein
MSTHEEILRFPNGHSVAQVKRNAKRLKNECNIPLNVALDRSAREAMGLPNSSICFSHALSILKATAPLCKEVNDANKAFNSGIVVAYEQKEAAGIDMASRLWRSDADLNRLMWPIMMTWLLQGYLDEGEYKAVTREDLSEIAIDCMDYCCYYYIGSTPLLAVGDVLKGLKTDCFFPPVAIWMQGKLNEEVSLIPYFSENYARF